MSSEGGVGQWEKGYLNQEALRCAICYWLPLLRTHREFLEWTVGDRLRHSKFVGLREDKNPKSVVKENKDEA